MLFKILLIICLLSIGHQLGNIAFTLHKILISLNSALSLIEDKHRKDDSAEYDDLL